MKSVIISDKDSGQSLQKLLKKKFPNLPRSLMYKEIRKKNIKVNKKRTEANAILKTGDILELYLNDDVLQEKEKFYDFLVASDSLDIVYEDKDLMIIDKSSGVLCHPAKGDYTDNIIARVQKYLYKKGEWDPDNNEFSPALVNRIDRNTSGLIIVAKNTESLKILNEKIRTHEIEKYYLALVYGVPKENNATLVSYLTKNTENNTVSVSQQETPNSKKIISEYTLLKTDGEKTLLEIKLKTGRTHQIRAQLSSIGLPIVNDGKYGKVHGRSRQKLCSYKLVFNFKSNKILTHLDKPEFYSKKCNFCDF